MSAGRPKTASAEPVNVQIDEGRVAVATQAMTDLAKLEGAITAEQVAFSQRVGERIGRRRAADALSKLLTVTDLLELQRLKESRSYRGMQVSNADGKLVTVSGWEDFCDSVVGRSRAQVDADLLNLKTFGAEFMESVQCLGVGYREMREMRSIPADQRTELLEAAKNGDRTTLIDVAEGLIERHAKEKAAVDAKVIDVEQQLVAKDKIIAKRDAKIAKYEADDDLAPEAAALKALNEAGAAAQIAVLQLAKVANEAMDQYIDQGLDLYARQSVAYIAQVIANLAHSHRIEIDMNQMVDAPWVTAATGGRKASKG